MVSLPNLSKLSTMSRPPIQSSFALKRRASRTFKETNLNQPIEEIARPIAKSSNNLAVDTNHDFPANSSFDLSFIEDTKVSTSKFARRAPEHTQTPKFNSKVAAQFPKVEKSPVANKNSFLMGLVGKVFLYTFWCNIVII